MVHAPSETKFLSGDISTFLSKTSKKEKIILLVDEKVLQNNIKIFGGYDYFVIPSGEKSKEWKLISKVIDFLFQKNADRKTLLIAIGGGVCTDIGGCVASLFMRGIRFGFIPTTVLAMVDASLGGKNGINWGKYKNMIGTIVQPSFLFYDYKFLKSLPHQEWVNGFAEIIKHACIYDRKMFAELEKYHISHYQKKSTSIKKLVERNVQIKYTIVQQDPTEKNLRRLLNFGHTLAHAIEKKSRIAHGKAVGIGMYYMSLLSEKRNKFKELQRIKNILLNYQLPITTQLNAEDILEFIQKDKKKENQQIFEILLSEIGSPQIIVMDVNDYQKEITNLLLSK